MATGLLGLAQNLLAGLWSGFQLLLQGLEVLLVLGLQPCQFGFVCGCLLFIGARFGIHLLGEDRVLFFFAFEQGGQLLIGFELLAGLMELCFELLDFALQLAQRRAGVAGHHEGAGLEAAAGLAECLVIPDAEGTGNFEAVQRLAMLGAELMGGLVALDAQGVEQAGNAAVELDLPTELIEQIGLGGGAIELDAGPAGQVLGQCFTELAQLDQGGVGVAGEHPLCRIGELEEDRVVLFEEGEVIAGGHRRSFE
ncbi:hypothetical protein D3C81_1209320 [compost metagenome]